MGRLRKKFAGNTAEASSEPLSSTPKSLKPKPKISRNSLDKGTPQIQDKKKKKKSVLGSRKPNFNSEREDDNSQSAIQKSTTGGKHDKMNQENIKIKEKGARLEKKQSPLSEENHDELGSQQDEKKKEKLDGIEKKRQFAKNKEKWFNKIEDGQSNEEKHGQLESKQNENQKEKLDDLEKKQHLDKKKDKWFKKTEHGETNEEKQGQLESHQNEKQKEKLDGLQKKQPSDKKKEKWFKNTEHGQTNEEKHDQLESRQNEKKKEKLGGLICMCSAKTKPDCFRYSVMGLPINNKEKVLGIKPGLKLFLYDFDLKLLYGIYTASSNGGMKLEPAAFGGGFPVQVRFSIYQDCYPLPESVFKKAIMENYNGKNRFDTELTDRQVENLTKLFRPAELHLHAPPMGPTPMPAVQGQHVMYGKVPSTEREYISANQFPSENEYRTYGLRGERPNFTPPGSQMTPPLEPHLGPVRQHLLMYPGYQYTEAAPTHVQLNTLHGLHVASEDQAYGLFPRQELRSSDPLAVTTSASIVDPCPKISYTHPHGASYLDSYRSPSGRDEGPLLGSHSFSGRGESYLTETTHLRRTENVDDAMLYSSYASNALSDHNQITKHQVVGPESSLAPVSSRYTFAGPSLSHR